MTRLAILTSHPIQYYAPLFRELTKHADLKVLFAHRQTAQQQAAAGFGQAFNWDVDLTSGYEHAFLVNAAPNPGVDRFMGTDAVDVYTQLQSGEFEAVLTLGWHIRALVQGIWAAKRLGLPVMVRGDSQLQGARSPARRAAKAALYPSLLRYAFDAALYVGQRNRDYYRHFGYPEDRLFFAPHCVDTEWFRIRATAEARREVREALGVTDETKLVLFAGKLVPFKRPLDVVEACAQLRALGRDVELMMVGSGALDEQIRTRAAELNMPTHMLGFRNQSRMPEAYAAADVLVLPSSGRETWGLVVNEALACGTPVVVSDATGCAADLARDGIAGRCFAMGDIAGLATALDQTRDKAKIASTITMCSDAYGLAGAAAGVMTALEALTRREIR